MERGYLQHRAELSQFDDSVVRERQRLEQEAIKKATAIRASDPLSDAIPGNDNILYNPNHHSADYGGFVSRDALEKAHFEGKQQESLIRNDAGVVPEKNVRTSDHIGIGKKHFENDVRFQSKEVVPGSAPLIADPFHYINGGHQDRFQSTAMDAQRNIPTDPQQFSNKSINHPHIGKKHVVPAFDIAGQQQQQQQYQQQHHHLYDRTNHSGGGGGGKRIEGSYAYEQPRGHGELVGYRATAFKPGAPSMLSGIGSSIAGGISRDFPDKPVKRETIADVRGREKGNHLLDGTPGLTPGYTGRSMR